MANLYLQMIENAKKLPAAYQAIGTRSQTLTDTGSGRTFTGWEICQYLYKMNEDGNEWWSNDFRLFVDTSGSLWNVELSEQYDPYPTPTRTSGVRLGMVDAERLRMWHTNGWDFEKMKLSIEAMI